MVSEREGDAQRVSDEETCVTRAGAGQHAARPRQASGGGAPGASGFWARVARMGARAQARFLAAPRRKSGGAPVSARSGRIAPRRRAVVAAESGEPCMITCAGGGEPLDMRSHQNEKVELMFLNVTESRSPPWGGLFVFHTHDPTPTSHA